MPVYVMRATYSAKAMRGVMEAGAQSRVPLINKMVESVGGSVLAHGWELPAVNNTAVFDLPDDAAANAIAMTAFSGSAGGLIDVTRLYTATEVDEAIGRSAAFTPPGS